MKALFLIQGFDTAASRYRVLQYLPLLRADGVETEVREHPRGWRASLASALSYGRYDAVFVQRRRLGAAARAAARRSARRLVFDFDDAVMFRNSLARSPRSRARAASFRRMVSLCHCVLAGNSFLAEQTRPHTRADVRVLPTPIDTARYEPRDHPAENADTVTLGWIGAHGSIHYLERLAPLWDRLHRAEPRLRLKIICDTFFPLRSMPVIETPWSEETEVDELRTFDIGVMPLLDDPWSRGKCGLKILQYLAAGVPVVATPVGINRDIVRHGVEGFHASSEEEWMEGVLALARDPGLRARMGAAGHATVRDRYSVQALYPLFREAVLGGREVRGS